MLFSWYSKCIYTHTKHKKGNKQTGLEKDLWFVGDGRNDETVSERGKFWVETGRVEMKNENELR